MRAFNLSKAVCISALLSTIGAAAHAAPCTNATLHGSFGYQEQGQALGAGFPEFRSVGVFTFNGDGTGSRIATLWYSNFSVVPEAPSPVTYTVRPNCIFDFAYPYNGEAFTGVIILSGQKLLYLETTGDPMRSGQAEKVRTNQ
jgi:hypothetical protein